MKGIASNSIRIFHEIDGRLLPIKPSLFSKHVLKNQMFKALGFLVYPRGIKTSLAETF
ncbi:MAG: hypothetical protein GXO25_04070 [Euryarchaeota archaeon]|nr:hypothetical protein [Euryarchaeota archaeon]